jgi:hypothetical protein
VEGSNRTRIVALAVLLAISIPLIVIAVAGGGSDDGESEGLRVERSAGVPEVVIYLQDPAMNDPNTNRGRTRVRVECLDAGGTVIFRGAERWPLSDTDGGRFDPHVHVLVGPGVVDRIERCRLRGTDPPLAGPKV